MCDNSQNCLERFTQPHPELKLKYIFVIYSRHSFWFEGLTSLLELQLVYFWPRDMMWNSIVPVKMVINWVSSIPPAFSYVRFVQVSSFPLDDGRRNHWWYLQVNWKSSFLWVKLIYLLEDQLLLHENPNNLT